MKHGAIFFAVIAFGMPIAMFAHGMVEKSAGNVTFFLNQSPISPLVGEKVHMTFVVADRRNVSDALRSFKVKLALIDTFYGDESKDKTIFTEDKITDANGAFDFEYTFDKENYFDVELSFVDPVGGEKEVTGFLVEPRDARKAMSGTTTPLITQTQPLYIWPIIIFGIIGIFVGAALKMKGAKA